MSAHRVVSLGFVVMLLSAAFVLGPSRPALVASSTDAGMIAYVRRSTHDIHIIAPDGTGDRVLWTAPHPLGLFAPHDLAWRPDGRELAFSSEHEETCSWYQSDIYAIRYNGTGYRRVTNAPACAALAALPKGSVTVDVTNWTSVPIQAYVQGAPGITPPFYDGTVTIDNVADLGPGALQPAVGIDGAYRTLAYPPLADVQPGATVAGGALIITFYSGVDALGPGKVSWNADGSALAYGMRTYSRISQVDANPPYGSIGEPLPVVEHAWPNLVAWGPTAATKDQYLYSSKDDSIYLEVAGIYLNTADSASGGTQLVPISAYYGAEVVYDIEWLPDGSGFLFTKRYFDFEISYDPLANIFEYNLATQGVTRLTSLTDDSARALSISPDGEQIVFERGEGFDATSSLWMVNRDSSGLHKLADDAGRPAWGPSPVPEQVHAEFVGTPTSGVRPLLVQFTNQSTGDYDTCTWSFGDGGTSTSCGNPTHTYAAEGAYTVALTVDGSGGTDAQTKDRYITVQEGYRAHLPLVIRGH